MTMYEYKPAPPDVKQFLESRGWKEWRPMMPGWERPNPSKAELASPHRTDDYSWEQAVAIEFMEFITLGGKQNDPR